jgi:HD superfamily phosphohydrolase
VDRSRAAPATWAPAPDEPPVRIPVRGNVPASGAVRALLDTAPMQRLRGVRQLGVGHLVYPGATHTRFEHSLGVYAVGRMLLGHLMARGGRRFLTEEDGHAFLAACLLHDVGHYPFSHMLEELPPDEDGRPAVPRHDERARAILLGDPGVRRVLEERWGCDPERIAAIIDERSTAGGEAEARLRHMLCGPLNPDRLDYLERDSQHVGVPYGRVIDVERLLATVDFTPDGRQLGVTPKGVSAVETLIFASYLMYREIYWHHAVRAAQAMLKRAAAEALRRGEVAGECLVAADDEQAVALLRACRNPATAELMAGLSHGRRLYRRLFSGGVGTIEELPPGAGRDLLRRLAEVDPAGGEALLAEVVKRYAARSRAAALPHHLLWDVAGRDKELFFTVPVLGGPGRLRTTADPEVSLIAPTLAVNFERHAKRLQLLAHPAHARGLAAYLGLPLPAGSAEREADPLELAEELGRPGGTG